MNREPIFNVPSALVWTLVLLILVYVMQSMLPDELSARFILSLAFIPARYAGLAAELPGGYLSAVTSLVTYMVVHGDMTHLLVNGAWLLAFGGAVARRIGGVWFLFFAIFCGLAAILLYWVLHIGEFTPVVGASGAVSGLMAAALRFFIPAIRSGGLSDLRYRPSQVPLAPLSAMVRDPQILAIVGIWIALNFLFGIGGSLYTNGAGIAWEAHLGGFLAGLFAFSLFDRHADRSLPSID